MMSTVIEQVCSIALFGLVALRAPAAWRDPRARTLWRATVFGAFGLLCRGALVPASVLDGLLGGHNWLNLVQNLSAASAFWFGARAVLGLTLDRIPRNHVLGLLAALILISVPFILIDKRGTTDGRMFIVDHIDQMPTFIYVVVYTVCVGGLAGALLAGIRRRRSLFYWPFRVGAIAVIVAAVEEIVYATMAHWSLGSIVVRGELYHAFTPIFYPGLLLLMVASFLFAAERAGQRRRALRLIAILDPSLAHHRLAAGAELAQLYEVVVRVRNAQYSSGGPNTAGAEEAEALLSRYLAEQIPDFRRPVTYKPQ